MNPRVPFLLLSAGILVLLAFLHSNTGERLRIVVESGTYQFAPATVRLRIRVEPDAANRALAVGLISDGYETSSLEQLSGAQAPITRWVEYHDIPAGVYAVVATVHRPDADPWRAATAVTVVGQ